MRAVVLTEYGDIDTLSVSDIPPPVAGPDEVLVNLAATALNRADLLQRRGLYPGPPAEHEIPGLEYAGTVSALGDRVTDFEIGDKVMGIVSGFSYAEQLVTHERLILRVPEPVSLADAAAIPEVFMTAFDALVVQGGLTSGRTALIHAGASGVGTAGIQIAKAIGARVAITASEPKLAACSELGADCAVDYRADSLKDDLKEYAPEGYDVVLDVVGGPHTPLNVSVLAVGGAIIQVGTMAGAKVEINLGQLMFKRGSLTGTVLRSRPLEEKAQLTQRFGKEILPLFGDSILKPVIDSRFDFTTEGVRAAQTKMESNSNIGKILLEVA